MKKVQKTSHTPLSSSRLDASRRWYLVNAEGQVLGRMASRIATLLTGKHKPDYTPFLDHGDFVVVINAEKVQLTKDKWEKKKYFRHSGYLGGVKEIPYKKLREKKPEFIVEKAVWGMMPKTRLGKAQFKRLKVYAGPFHPHEAQKPIPISLFSSGKKPPSSP
ncbi:MAG: 50S ribosomal protein L13 [bacterium JZ-2024 1]